jgi:excisionase family DNA binding protein
MRERDNDRGRDDLPATLTVEEAARYLRISRALAYEGVRNGSIPSWRIGRRVLIPTRKLLALLGEEER